MENNDKQVYLKAVMYAVDAHDGQFDLNGARYFGHPARVARYVKVSSGKNYIAMTAAILHDVIEDCGVSFEEIQDVLGLSDAIVDILKLLTRLPDETYVEFIDRIIASGNMLAILVKLCDIKDNLDPSRAYPDEEKAARLVARYLAAKEKLEAVYFEV